jgi:hypothetical protein
MRFFFDYKTDDRALYDYRGDEFNSAKGAIEFAAEIAEGLNESLEDKWSGWSIEVRNPEGGMVFRIPLGKAPRRLVA